MRNTRHLFLAILLSFIFEKSTAGTTGSVENLVKLADSLKAMLTTSQVSTLQLAYTYSNSQTWSNKNLKLTRSLISAKFTLSHKL